MAKVFLSYSAQDRAYVEILSDLLKQYGQQVAVDISLTLGSDWRAQLTESLKSSQVFIVVLSQYSISAAYPMAELGRALAMAEGGEMLIIPIAIDDISIPVLLQDKFILFAAGRKIEEYFPEILGAISRHEEILEKNKLNIIKVENDIAKFVTEAISSQTKSEKNNRSWSIFWYFSGIFFLLLAIFSVLLILLYVVKIMNVSAVDGFDVFRAVGVVFLNITVVGVFVALAKYSYSLGKAYMDESLKSSDRIHAIQFGMFFVKAYGSKLTVNEVRDAFQHWNIDRKSNFSLNELSSIDPNIFSLVGQIVNLVGGKISK